MDSNSTKIIQQKIITANYYLYMYYLYISKTKQC